MQNWLTQNMESVLWIIEILWILGVALIFVVYFVIKHKIKKAKLEKQQ